MSEKQPAYHPFPPCHPFHRPSLPRYSDTQLTSIPLPRRSRDKRTCYSRQANSEPNNRPSSIAPFYSRAGFYPLLTIICKRRNFAYCMGIQVSYPHESTIEGYVAGTTSNTDCGDHRIGDNVDLAHRVPIQVCYPDESTIEGY